MNLPLRRSASALLIAVPVAGCGSAVPPSAASAVPAPPRSVAHPVDADPRIGALFTFGGDIHSCTASVLHSRTGDLILTAAHCAPAGQGATFVPGFAGSSTPDQVWSVTAAYLDPRWVTTRDAHADYAILRVARTDGAEVEERAGGAFVLAAGAEPGAAVTVIGYPIGVGGAPVGCGGVTGRHGEYPSLDCVGMVDGTSGAPWFAGATVDGVTGGLEGGGCGADVSYSAPFDAATLQLLARAEAAPADDPGDMAQAVPDAGPDGSDDC